MLVNDECEIILQPIRSICRIPSTIVLILVYYIKIELVEPNFEVGIFVFPITCVKPPRLKLLGLNTHTIQRITLQTLSGKWVMHEDTSGLWNQKFAWVKMQ